MTLLAVFFKELIAKFSASAAVALLQEGALQRARAAEASGDLATAQAAYRQIVQQHSDNQEALFRLGLLAARGRHDTEAAGFLERALKLEPTHIATINALANVRQLQHRWDEAEQLYRQALALQPETSTVWSNLGLCLREAGRIEDACHALYQALGINPHSADVLLNLAMVLMDSGELAKARPLLERCLEINPELAEAHTGLAHLLLQQGDFAAGWREYRWRFKLDDAEPQADFALPRWTGQRLTDRVLWVRAEQGLGDQIMLASCLPDVMALVQSCWVECDPRLVRLFARSFPQASFYPYHPKRRPGWESNRRSPDFQIHCGDLPGLFRNQPSDFPQHDGYLLPDPARVEYWRTRLAGLGAGPKIGISWRGGAARTHSARRSLALEQLSPILKSAGIVPVSLQYGNVRGELDDYTRSNSIVVHHWQEAIDDYDETAALVAALDGLVTVQTAVVHLSGALGKRTSVLVPAVPEWRYMAEGSRLPWYPSVTLFRQSPPTGWDAVIGQVAANFQRAIG